MGIGSVAGAFVAGVLTVLSPCVLPILPIVLGAAASERKYGPAALAAGLAVSFAAIGLFVATVGYSVGLTADLFRQIAAALMIVLGAVLLLPSLQARLAIANRELDRSPLWHAAQRRLCRSIFCRVDPRRGVDPMRRSDARCCLAVGGARSTTAAGRP
jgi:cytochrome c biogenesis protein CcdA